MSLKVFLVDTNLAAGLLDHRVWLHVVDISEVAKTTYSYQDISILVAQHPYRNLVMSALLIHTGWNKVVPPIV